MSVAELQVADDEADIRLDRWFRRRYPALTQGVLQKMCRTGQIRVDGARVEAATRLSAGQIVRVPPGAEAATRDETPVSDPRDAAELARMVLYEDDAMLAIDKPSGIASQGGPGIRRHVDRLAASWRDATGRRPLLVHRLDRDTSGVMVLAKGASNAARLAALFRTRRIEKTYWALVVGRPVPAEGVIDASLARIGAGAGALTMIADRDDEDAAVSRTAYRTLDHAGRKLAWLELQPRTGRTHQLRVHCEALGTPILGDPKYGNGRSLINGFEARLHLHARALALPHPSGGRIVLTAPLPGHMRESFARVGFEIPRADPVERVAS